MRTKTAFLSLVLPGTLALGIGLGSPGSALAGEGVIGWRPGTTCVAGKNDASKINYSQQGVLNESTSSTAKVWCPLLVDQEYYVANELFMALEVLDQNGGSGKDVSCTVWGMTHGGSVGYNPPPSNKSAGSSSTTQWLQFDALPDPLMLTYAVSCSLPVQTNGKKSGVVSYGPIGHD